jgi:UDP-N-acetylmuramate dehydrogenase
MPDEIHTQKDVSLKPFNTFGLDVKASEFKEVHTLDQLRDIVKHLKDKPFMILGGGSNVLFTKDYEGMVLKNNIRGNEIVHETADHVFLKIKSGENWHEQVMYCVAHKWGGIENLSLIPGTVGAAPMQNIGAYGVELERVFISLEALNLETLELQTFHKEECEFGYRESVFKRKFKGKYFIYSVTLRLDKEPAIYAEYGDIKTVLAEKGIDWQDARIADISEAVIQIRQSKLPDPKEIGNSGSFFKNPVIEQKHFDQLKSEYSEIKGFEQYNGIKVPAAWLIEQCGWKGKKIGNTGSHARQALVLVNYGGASGNEIWQLAQDIIKSVSDKFGIRLEPEVNII